MNAKLKKVALHNACRCQSCGTVKFMFYTGLSFDVDYSKFFVNCAILFSHDNLWKICV